MKFSVLLWPPIYSHIEEVTKFIGGRFEIVEKNDYELDNKAFHEFLWKIYRYDKTPGARIKRKELGINKYERKIFRHLLIEVSKPNITPHRKKRLKGKSYSLVMKSLKNKVRKRFKGKVKHYVHDIIVHIGDDDEHTKFIAKLLSVIKAT